MAKKKKKKYQGRSRKEGQHIAIKKLEKKKYFVRNMSKLHVIDNGYDNSFKKYFYFFVKVKFSQSKMHRF